MEIILLNITIFRNKILYYVFFQIPAKNRETYNNGQWRSKVDQWNDFFLPVSPPSFLLPEKKNTTQFLKVRYVKKVSTCEKGVNLWKRCQPTKLVQKFCVPIATRRKFWFWVRKRNKNIFWFYYYEETSIRIMMEHAVKSIPLRLRLIRHFRNSTVGQWNVEKWQRR